MAYKFQRGAAVASGSFTAEEGLTATTGGLTISAGTVTLPASSVATAALAASSVTIGSTSVSLGATATSLDGLTTVDTTNIEVTNIKAKDGTAAVTVADTTGHVTITNLTGTSVDINGGTIDGATIATSNITVGAGKTLDVSAGTLTLAAGQVTADKVGPGTFNAGTYSFAGSTISSIPAVTQFTASNSSLGAATATSLSSSNNIQGGGSLTVAGATVLNGNVTLGDASTDVLAVLGQFTSSLVPRVSGEVNIGSPTNLWLGISGNELSASLRVRAGTQVIAGTSISAGTSITGQTLTASNGANLNATVVTTITGSSTATFQSMTSNAVTIGGGTINATPIGGTTQAAGQFTTLSASSTLQVAGAATLNNGLTVSNGDSSVQKLTVNGDLIVLGTTFSASVGSLLIEDAAIVIGDGSTTFGTGYGLLFGSGSNQWASLETAQANIDGVAGNENVLSSSLPIKAPSFAGTVYGTIAATVTGIGNADATLVTGVNYGTTNLTAPRTWTLPSAPVVGDSVKIKAPGNCDTTNYITVQKDGGTSHTIDGETFIVLESNWAAIECVYVASDLWRIF